MPKSVFTQYYRFGTIGAFEAPGRIDCRRVCLIVARISATPFPDPPLERIRLASGDRLDLATRAVKRLDRTETQRSAPSVRSAVPRKRGGYSKEFNTSRGLISIWPRLRQWRCIGQSGHR